MNYPGDPPVEVVEMTRAEFLEAYPRHPIVFTSVEPDGSIKRKEYQVGPDDIQCDLCCADPGETVWVLRLGTVVRGHCADCARQGWLPYCEEVK